MKVFVTGATGVLGRRVLPLLAAAGHEVTAVSRGKPDKLRAAGAEPVELDLFDRGAVKAAVGGHDAVLDLATRIPGTKRMALPWAWRENDRLRSEASAIAADAAIATGARYVRESFGLVYADAGDRWVGEGAPVDAIANTRTALDAEAAADRVTAAGGVGVVLRFALFYGPDSPQTADLLAAADRGLAAVLGPGDAFEPHVHLDDAAAAVVAALDAPPGTYNVVEDEPLRKAELVAVLERIAGRRLRTPPAALTRLGPARVLGRSVRLDNARLRDATGWAPRYADAGEGLRGVASSLAG